jgi:hypothetical protein
MSRATKAREPLDVRLGPAECSWRMAIEVVTIREIERIFELTDRLGVHREMLVIPLAPRRPGRVRRLPGGKLEIAVDPDFDAWFPSLEGELRKAIG